MGGEVRGKSDAVAYSQPKIGTTHSGSVYTSFAMVPFLSRFLERLSQEMENPKRLALMVLGVFVFFCLVSGGVRIAAIRTALRVIGHPPQQDAYGYTNLLLLGVGDKEHDGADLTDTMMLASIDPFSTHGVVFLSIPRDLYIADAAKPRVPSRINAVYSNEKYRLMRREGLDEKEASEQAMATVEQEIERILGLPIHGVVKVDFSALTGMVDALGGVDVWVPERLYDSTYPVREGRVGLFTLDAGQQHLDGETALKYARSRHTTSDFDRSSRQQQILSALVSKMRGLSLPAKVWMIPKLYSNVHAHVETTLSLGELFGLTQVAMELSSRRFVRMQINYDTGSDGSDAAAGGFVYAPPSESYGGASVLLPTPLKSGTADWRQLQMFVRLLVYHRTFYLSHPRVLIVNIAATNSAAHRLRNELLRYGFTVEKTVRPPKEEAASFEDSFVSYKSGLDAEAARFFGTLLHLPVAREKDPGISGTGSGDIVLLLGKDYSFKPFASLSGALLPTR